VADGLEYTYPGGQQPALRDVSFRLEPGGCLLVLGPSGSGKSTLALAIAGLVPRVLGGTLRGRLAIDGREVRELDGPALARRVGIVFQEPASQLVMERVEDDVAFGLENLAWPREAMRRRVPEALSQVGLLALARRRSVTLSGGEQQRLALAGVLAPMPGLLVLDEPTANLDPWGAAAFLASLGELRAARQTTIVLIEHRVDEVWPLADLVLALGPDGSPIDLGHPEEVLIRSWSALERAGIWLPRRSAIAAGGNGLALPGGAGATPPARSGVGLVAPAAAPGGGETGVADGLLLSASGVAFGYLPGRAVLQEIDLVLRAGERVALVGPNGSGKSTLGRLLVGLLRPTAGRIRLAGRDPARLPAAVLAREAGYLFQDPQRQFLTDRVVDELTLGLRPEERRRVPEVAQAVGLPLERYGDRSPYTLSGGEQRRLSLACLFVRRPRLLVLDEPTFGQDRAGYDALVRLLHEQMAAGTTLVAATHDRRLVADIAQRVIALRGGRVALDQDATEDGADVLWDRAFPELAPSPAAGHRPSAVGAAVGGIAADLDGGPPNEVRE
jgi:energy-coupling factor transporter ATP-binding protein EcfA2